MDDKTEDFADILARSAIRVRPGDSFDTLEQALAALAVTTRALNYCGRMVSPAHWQASVMGMWMYDSEERIVYFGPGAGSRAALKKAIAAFVLHDLGIPESAAVFRNREMLLQVFDKLRLQILESSDGWLAPWESADQGDKNLRLRELAAKGRIEVVQANPDVDDIFDQEDRQPAVAVEDCLCLDFHPHGPVALAVLPARPSSKDYDRLEGILGVDVMGRPVTIRSADASIVADAAKMRDVLRAWRHVTVSA